MRGTEFLAGDTTCCANVFLRLPTDRSTENKTGSCLRVKQTRRMGADKWDATSDVMWPLFVRVGEFGGAQGLLLAVSFGFANNREVETRQRHAYNCGYPVWR